MSAGQTTPENTTTREQAETAVLAAWSMPQARSGQDPNFWELRYARHAALAEAYLDLATHMFGNKALHRALIDASVAHEAKREQAAEYAEKRRARLAGEGSPEWHSLHHSDQGQQSPIQSGKWYREHTAQELADELARRGLPVPHPLAADADALADMLRADDARREAVSR